MNIERLQAGRAAAKAAKAAGTYVRKLPASPRAAIKAHCRDCIYDPKAGGSASEQIAACDCTRCALWPFRPVLRAPRKTASDNASCWTGETTGAVDAP